MVVTPYQVDRRLTHWGVAPTIVLQSLQAYVDETMSCTDAATLPCECSCLLSLGGQYKEGPQESSSGTISVCLASVYLASLYVTKFPKLSPSSGGNEALETRLLVSEQSFLWVQPHYVGMFNKALLCKHFPVIAYFSKLLVHFNPLRL